MTDMQLQLGIPDATADSKSLAQARAEVAQKRWSTSGTRCPCCGQLAKVYRRKINSSMAADLIAMYRAFGREWGYLPDLRKRSSLKGNREESKLRYWGLVEETDDRREDGGHAGWWRVTELGELFVTRRATVSKYVRVYDAEALSFDGPNVDITSALGSEFRYDELMRGY
jgi:hypothetical protein